MAEKNPWAVALASAIGEWCKLNGYKYKSILGEELKIPIHAWHHVIRGDSITSAEIYARIFLKTNLQESDPRTIPHRIVTVPGFGTKIVYRQWTDEELLSWLAVQKNNDKISLTVDHQTLGEDLKRLISTLQLYSRASSSHIGHLIQTHGKQLGELYALLSLLTLSDEDREISYHLSEELK